MILRIQHAIIVASFACTALLPRLVNAQANCDEAFLQAEEAYRAGEFSSAITALAPCVDRYRAGTEQDQGAHRLLALAYLRSDQIEEARLVIVELFARNPRYEADPVVDPPAFVSLVNLVREEVGVESRAEGGGGGGGVDRPVWYRSPRTWLYAAGGLVVGTAAILAIGGGGGGGSNSLPPPPAWP